MKKGEEILRKILDFVVFGLINLKYKAAKQEIFFGLFSS